jgi:putative protease
MKRVELLAPAKNLKAIKAASKFVDSVYFGIEKFNMRMRSENIALEDLADVVNYCHERNLKAYLATNILIYDNELNYLRDILERAKDVNIDAVIVHDLAVIEIAKQLGLKFHISTQCNVSNSLAAKFYENLGAERIILARELSLEKIKEIKRNLATIEIEVFIHGAMCTSVSGRCYFSQDICGSEEKSANRGSCVQPCRRRWWVREESGNEYIYDGTRFMNSRDLCTIAYIPDLIEANVDAFKIEGRMRHPHYVETVSRVYREAIDAYYEGNFSDKKVGGWVTELKKVYNRGFTPGFYFKRMTEGDHQHKSPANLSHFRYIRVGNIIAYDEASGFAEISLNNGYMVLNDDIIIMGKKNDTYVHQKAKLLRYKGKEVEKTPRGTKKENIIFELKLEESIIGNPTEKVYIFTDKTYFKKEYSL